MSNYTQNGQGNNQPSFGERLALIAQVIVTIGDILATVSAGILIEEGIAEANKAEKEKIEAEAQMSKMQNQIESLQREITKIKKNNN